MTIKPTKNYHNHLTRIATFCALLYCNSAFCAELVEYDHTFLMGRMPQILISAGIVKVTLLYRVCTTSVFMSTINLLLTKALHLLKLKEKKRTSLYHT